MKRRILVLGSDGYVGRRLIESLLREHSTWATPVATSRRGLAAIPGIEGRLFDERDPAALAVAIADTDSVVNCIAGSANDIVANGSALFDALGRQQKYPRVIHLSTMPVYGSATGNIPESSPLKADLGPYSVARVEVEKLAATYRAMVVLRPGCIYGPGSPQWSTRIARWLHARRIGDLGAAGDGRSNLVYIDDVVSAIVQVIRADGVEGQAFNLAMRSAPTWNEYFVSFAIALGAVPVARLSRRDLQVETKLFAPPLKIAERLLAASGIKTGWLPEPIPPSLLRLWQQDICLDVEKAERLLQMTWTPLAEGLSQAAAGFRAAGRRT